MNMLAALFQSQYFYEFLWCLTARCCDQTPGNCFKKRKKLNSRHIQQVPVCVCLCGCLCACVHLCVRACVLYLANNLLWHFICHWSRNEPWQHAVTANPKPGEREAETQVSFRSAHARRCITLFYLLSSLAAVLVKPSTPALEAA